MVNHSPEQDVPTWSLAKFAKLNKPATVFVAGAAAVFVPIAALIQFKFGLLTLIPYATVVIFIAILVTVFTRRGAVSGPALVLQWFTVVAFMAFCLGVVYVFLTNKPAPLPCLASPSSQECGLAKGALEKAVVSKNPESEVADDQQLDQKSLPAVQPPAPPPTQQLAEETAEFASLPVYIQFSGYRRPQIVTMASRLSENGWAIQGADRGGQRLVEAKNFNEIRYREANLRAAQLLADQINSQQFLKNSVKLTQTNLVKEDTLELWVSE
jgi:hypothetical protein